MKNLQRTEESKTYLFYTTLLRNKVLDELLVLLDLFSAVWQMLSALESQAFQPQRPT